MRIKCDGGCGGTGLIRHWKFGLENCLKCDGTGTIRHSDEDADFMDEPLCDEEPKDLEERLRREA
jgi:hypothetical protein